MTKRLLLAAILGVLVGIGLARTPLVPSAYPPQSRLLIQPAARPNVVVSAYSPTLGLEPLAAALVCALLVAIPVFVLARRKAM